MVLAPLAKRLLPHSVRHWLRTATAPRPPDYARLWERACPKWSLGFADRAGGEVHVSGWLVAPPAMRAHVEFRVNGRAASRANFPVPRPDVAAHYPFLSDVASSGFDAWAPWPGDATDLEITAHDRRTGRPLGPHYTPWWVPAPTHAGPAPDGARVRRVIGQALDFNFRMGGLTAAKGLAAALRATTGQTFSDLPRVLDWGCGCSRVARFVMAEPGVRLTGVDVDADNVAWSRANFPHADWRVVPLRPPTDLPPAGFDLAYGVSVFTHLKEPDQHLWLDELRRVLRPGGIALMTYHGEASLVCSRLGGERYRELCRRGICDQENTLYDADLPEGDYYRDTFHTTDYVRRTWGRSFELLGTFPAAISHQDLAVLRRI